MPDDPKTPKYKSIDDILEALKDQSLEQEDEDSHSHRSNLKTARQLKEELSASSHQSSAKPGDSEEEQEEDEKNSIDDSPDQPKRADNPPQKSEVFGDRDSDNESEEETAESDKDVHPKEEADTSEENPYGKTAYEPSDDHPESNSQDEPEKDSPPSEPEEIHHQPAEPIEHTLDDLASEDSNQETSETDIPRITPHSNPQTFHNPNQNRPTSFNNHQFDYTLDKPGSRMDKMHIFILALIGLGVIGGAVFFLKHPFSLPGQNKQAVIVTTSSPTPSPTQSPTPEPIDRSKFKIRVLNGTTKSGLAGTVSAKLKDLGYLTPEKGANATNSAFPRTVVRVKGTNASLSAQLIKDLSSGYDAEASTPLKASDSVDAEVILGPK